jgi:carboxymethylenebutenolidase
VTDRLAAEGYVAIAPELFHRTAPGFEGDYENFQAVQPHVKAVTAENAEQDLRAAYHWLQSCPYARPDDVSSVGFCMGGRTAFLANATLPLRAAASFYGRVPAELLPRAAESHGPLLLVWGLLDKHIGAEQREAMKAALDQHHKVYVSAEFSNADHGFFCDERSAYQPDAARQAWALLLEFLRPARS